MVTVILDYTAYLRVSDTTREGILAEMGWSKNDFLMFSSWFALDNERYSLESLRHLASRLPKYNAQLTAAQVGGFLKKILDDRFTRNCILFLLFALVFVVLDSRSGSVVIAVPFLIAALLIYVTLFKKPPPDRVYYPVFAYMALVPLFLTGTQRLILVSKSRPLRKVIGVVLCVVVFVQGASAFASYGEASKQNAAIQRWYRRTLQDLQAKPSQLYVAWTGAVGWQYLAPFGGVDFLKGFTALDSLPYPSTVSGLRRFGVKDAYAAMATNENVYVIAQTMSAGSNLAMYRQYMIEHYALDVTWQRVATNQAFEVYDLSVRATPPDPEQREGSTAKP
jgi:hypothetical protein